MNVPVTRRVRLIAARTLLLGAAVCGGCTNFFESPATSSPVNVRIENHTSSFVEVILTVSDEETSGQPSDSGSGGAGGTSGDSLGGGDTTVGHTLPPVEPTDTGSNGAGATSTPPASETAAGLGAATEVVTIGLREPPPPEETALPAAKAAAVAAKTTLSEGTVRVAPQTFSDGVVACGDEITVSARTEGGAASGILFSGAGTGTAGFDSGSVGLEGERLLLNRVHFECGETVIIRVTGDAGSTGSGTTGTGEIEVFERGETPPEAVFAAAGTVEPGEEFVEVRIENDTGSFAQLHLVVGEPAGLVTAVAFQGEESDGGFDVRVPPGFLSTGVVACASQIILVGSVVVPGVGIAQPDTYTQVVLSGLGTGTANFDENSVGTAIQQRFLLQDMHYVCGDVIQVEFTQDGDPQGDQPTIGQATISLVP
jgi:hypothetical protein